MTKKIDFVTLKIVLGCSILHYLPPFFIYEFERKNICSLHLNSNSLVPVRKKVYKTNLCCLSDG